MNKFQVNTIIIIGECGGESAEGREGEIKFPCFKRVDIKRLSNLHRKVLPSFLQVFL